MLKEPKRIIAEEPTAQEYSTENSIWGNIRQKLKINHYREVITWWTNVDVMKKIVTADNDFVNNKPAMEEMAKDESYPCIQF